MKKKRKSNKKLFLIVIIFLLGLATYYYFKNDNFIKQTDENTTPTTQTKKEKEEKSELEKLGYTEEEIKLISKKLEEEELKILKENEYNRNFVDLLNLSYYKKENTERYLKYLETNSSKNKEEIVTDVNMNLDYGFYNKDIDIEEPNRIDLIVNKFYKLSSNYKPSDLEKISSEYSTRELYLRSEAKEAFESMAKKMKEEGLIIKAMSTYRSYSDQESIYNRYVKADGKEEADTYSARPGYSEHQTGLAVDMQDSNNYYLNFYKSEEYQWMQKNAHKYGFILRYPSDKVDKTGYSYESWHYRYLGVKLATALYEQKLTLDQYVARN